MASHEYKTYSRFNMLAVKTLLKQFINSVIIVLYGSMDFRRMVTILDT